MKIHIFNTASGVPGRRRTCRYNRLIIGGMAAVIVMSTFASLPEAWAGTLTAGDLLIYRVGNGTETLSNTGNSVFLDEYTPTGSLVQSIAVPNSGATPLIASGTAGSEGLLNYNNGYVTLTGYGRAVGGTGSVVTTTSAAVPREAAIYGTNGTQLSITGLTDWASGNNPRQRRDRRWCQPVPWWSDRRCADWKYTVGATTSTQVNASGTTNVRDVNIFAGTTYFSLSSTTANVSGIYAVAPGGTQTQIVATSSVAGSSAAGNSPYQFAFAQLNSTSTGADTLYIADTNLNGIEKYSLVGGTWTATGTITGVTGAVGLSLSTTTVGSTTTVNLYATNASGLFSAADTTGYDGTVSGAATSIATVGTNEAFRGVAFETVVAPVPEPTTVLGGVLLIGAAGWSQRRRLLGLSLAA